jgi:glyoxylase-like metal-dependent hydrolase (beta-lactamase superfamily II)
MDGQTRELLARGRLTCHCLLIEVGSELVLVDTGFGLRDVANPKSRLSRFFLALVSPEFRAEMTAIRQVERLGFEPRDVRHVLLTHLDFDHAGGLDDFPWARVHLLGREREHAALRRTWLDRQRFRPQQWSYQEQWRSYADGGETWFGFEQARTLDGLPPELLFVPLFGHTLGHVGVAVGQRDRWLFHAGDAYFYHREMDRERPYCTWGLRMYQLLMDKDRRARLNNQARLRQLRHEHGARVEVFCSHDVVEFERLAGRPAALPAEVLAARIGVAVGPAGNAFPPS